jgi:hypothetical protein
MRTRLANRSQYENTRAKLSELEAMYSRALDREMATPELKQLSLYSLRRMINQLKEELILYECDVRSGRLPDEVASPH